MALATSHMRRFLLLLLCALGATVLPCQPAQAAPATLKIGISLSLTGRYAEFGDMNVKAYRLWAQDVNGRGGLLGKSVELVVRDDKSNAQTAAGLYRQLIENDKVDLVLGPYSSDITEAVSNVTEPRHFPLLASGAAADSLWQGERRYLFGVYVSANKYTVGFLEMLVAHDLDRVAVISADDLFSRNLAIGTKEWAKRFGLTITFFEEFKKGTANLADLMRRAQASGAQSLMVMGYLDEAVNARLSLKEAGWTPRAFYATVGPALPKFQEILKQDAADLAFSSSQWEPSSPFPGAKQFADAFVKTYRQVPSYHAASAYAAGQILEAAIAKTHSLDREKLRDALAALDAVTILGRYGVDHTGRQIRHFTSTIQWQHGKKEIVAPDELSTAKPVWR